MIYPKLQWLRVDKKSGRTLYILLQDIKVNGYLIPAGLVTDMGTIPLFLQWFISSSGNMAPFFILHDWFYVTHLIDRKSADTMLKNDMIKTEGSIKANIAYLFVRLFGHGKNSWDAKNNPQNSLLLSKLNIPNPCP